MPPTREKKGKEETVQVLDLNATDPVLKGFQGGFASGGYAYFVPSIISGKVARVDLANFSQVQALDLTATDSGLGGFCGGFASGNYSYFVPFKDYTGPSLVDESYSGKVVRIGLTKGSLILMIWSGITILACVLCS